MEQICQKMLQSQQLEVLGSFHFLLTESWEPILSQILLNNAVCSFLGVRWAKSLIVNVATHWDIVASSPAKIGYNIVFKTLG